MNTKDITDSIGIWNILLTAISTSLIILIGIKRMLKRPNKQEKYMILDSRVVKTLDGSETYKMTDNLTIKLLIDEKGELTNENISLKNEINELKKEYENLGFKMASYVFLLVIWHWLKGKGKN
jgi:hypothetical protein